MATIKVRVVGEIATNLTPEVKLVCQNEKYDVEFEFDESWANSNFKTALFIYNGKLIPIPFDGTVCKIPKLYDTQLLHIGVSSNDDKGLHTTTTARVSCLLSASDLTANEIAEPSPAVYDQIIGLLNKYIEQGSGSGSDGNIVRYNENGSITVAETPIENTDAASKAYVDSKRGTTLYKHTFILVDGEDEYDEYESRIEFISTRRDKYTYDPNEGYVDVNELETEAISAYFYDNFNAVGGRVISCYFDEIEDEDEYGDPVYWVDLNIVYVNSWWGDLEYHTIEKFSDLVTKYTVTKL